MPDVLAFMKAFGKEWRCMALRNARLTCAAPLLTIVLGLAGYPCLSLAAPDAEELLLCGHKEVFALDLEGGGKKVWSWWSSRVLFLGPEGEIQRPGERLYKARWNVPTLPLHGSKPGQTTR